MASITPRESVTRRKRWALPTRWPLVVIGGAAGVATWSGWVGLGGLTGFGPVNLLPGIGSGFTPNTAITLPMCVEAYAVYALGKATSDKNLDAWTRRYAWWSAWVALGVGMLGQVAYHLMTAFGVKAAPWWIVALVACMPVGILGAASYLLHLTRSERIGSGGVVAPEVMQAMEPMQAMHVDPAASDASVAPIASDAPDPIGSESHGSDRVESARSGGPVDRIDSAGSIESADASGAEVVSIDSHRHPIESTGSTRRTEARAEDVARIRAALKARTLPPELPASRVMAELRIGPTYARAAIARVREQDSHGQAEA